MSFRIFLLTFAIVCASSGTAAQGNEHGLDRANLDESVAACTDFYSYANGGWIKANPVPAENTVWDTFREIDERNQERLRAILEKSAEPRKDRTPIEQLVGDFYATAMNDKAIAKAGIEPIRAELAAIDRIRGIDEVVSLIRAAHASGEFLLFRFDIGPDLKDSSTYMASAAQGGLGLPDRDYYTKSDEASIKLRAQYETHIIRMLTLAGVPLADAKVQADAVLGLEIQLAEASLTRVERRDPLSSYHPMTLASANEITPHFDWFDYFKAQKLALPERFSVDQPKFFAALDDALVHQPVDAWKAYLRWHLLQRRAPLLSDRFVDADFDFYGKILRGQKQIKPRWKRALEEINRGIGEPLGQLYVEKYFNAAAKARAQSMVDDLKAALKARLEKLDWMSSETRAKALEKFSAFKTKIGYPDTWRDYSELKFKKGMGYVDLVRAAAAFENRYQMGKLGKPVDRSEWRMDPQTVNASYSAQFNDISFPAAILQPPFFDPDADAAVNYGGMGSIIGHELIHGYDDRGSQFDPEGNLKSWWTEADRKEFDARTARLVAQYGAYEALPGLRVNGKLTLGENIADLGGVLIAYDALRIELARKPAEDIDGFNPEQRFFLAWAQAWRQNTLDEERRVRINTDPHSPGRFRVMGPLSNIPSFAGAFRCKLGDAMAKAKDERVLIW